MELLKRALTTSVILASLTATTTFADKAPVTIPTDIPFAAGIDVPEAVKKECQLGVKVISFISAFGKKGVVQGDAGTGQYLDMEITNVFAPGGGAWSGPKWMEVSGTLKEGDKKIASFRAKRFSTGGAFGGFKGTCSILGRTTKAIGKDISIWLKNPTDGAALGDAKNN
jgi:hypothetical protein